MKILTLIVATGATLALLAPTAGARTALPCAAAHKAIVSVRGTDSATARENRFEQARESQFETARATLSAGTQKHVLSASTCAAIQSAVATLPPAIRYQIVREIARDVK
jgi:hypothetical protein